MPGEKITLLALALAGGIAIGWSQPHPVVWPWLAAAVATLVAASLIARFNGRAALALIAVSVLAFGAAWVTLRLHYVAPHDLATHLGTERQLVRVRGVALEPPELRDRAAGSMNRFGHRPPATYFLLEVQQLVSRHGVGARTCGRVQVRVEETVAPFRAGDHVEAVGLLYPPSPPRNPGSFDFRRYARAMGRAGMLNVGRRDLLVVTHSAGASPWAPWRRARNTLRRAASGWLLGDLPGREADHDDRDALLAALLLGQRGPELEGLGESFRRAGLAHFLAISGLHLGVMAGFVLFAARLTGRHRRWHGWLVVGAVLGYLVLVEPRMPVLRAGLMTIAACLGLAAGRRIRTSGLVSASAIALLLWRPDQLLGPGFQLSYGVVLGLLHLAPLVRARWFGPPDMFASSSSRMLGQWLRTTGAVALTAWLVALPVALYHWGVVWPLAAPFSVVVLPLVTGVLAVGYLKMLLAVALPSAALLLAVPLSLAADVLITLVRAMDAVPGSVVHVTRPSPAWALAAEVWIATWIVCAARIWTSARARRAVRAVGVLVLIWLAWPAITSRLGTGPALRLDMLAVGDGSCYVLRSGGRTVVFDAGSAGDFDAGRRTVVPALRRLGVRSVDTVVISHPNLDHYSAVLEIVDEFPAGGVLVTPQFFAAAAAEPEGPAMFLLDELGERYVFVSAVDARHARWFGASRWAWLRPDGATIRGEVNEGSMVVRIEAAGRTVLLCGDIEAGTIESLSNTHAGLRADVVELPHHGSHHRQAEAFVESLAPHVALQSTGLTRWHRTRARWRQPLAGLEHLVTARDGACWVEIDRDGTIHWGRYDDRDHEDTMHDPVRPAAEHHGVLRRKR